MNGHAFSCEKRTHQGHFPSFFSRFQSKIWNDVDFTCYRSGHSNTHLSALQQENECGKSITPGFLWLIASGNGGSNGTISFWLEI
jgi:hypothetical protein